MHILIDAHLAIKQIDGVSRYLIGILSELPKLDRSIQFTILTLPVEKSGVPEWIFNEPNVKRMIVNLMGPSPKQHLVIRRLLKRLNVDLYHHPQLDLPVGISIPTVVTVHDLIYIFHSEFFPKMRRLKKFYLQQSLKYSIRHADQIIAVSENTLKDMQKLYEVPPELVKVIHNGVTPVNHTEQAPGQKPNLVLPKDFILFVGTRRPHKNIQGLIKALAILRQDKLMNLDLVVAGKAYSGFREPEILVQCLGLNEHVHFLDFVPEEQLPILYQSALVIALPSFYEGFGFPVLEAMMYGKPVIASTVTSLPEVLGDAGLLVDPHDPLNIANKIYEILTNKQLSDKLSRKALQRSKLFSWKKVAESTLEVYLRALTKRNPSHTAITN